MTTPATNQDIVIGYGLLGIRVVRPSYLKVWIGPFLDKTFTISEGTMNVNASLGDNQFTTAHVAETDPAGMAFTPTKPFSWTVDDSTVVKITPDATDPLAQTCRIEAAIPAKLGVANVTCTSGDNPNLAPLVFTITVTAEAASVITGTLDPPTERPTPPTP